MKNEMKAFVIYGKADGKITNVAFPTVGENDVLVKVCYCGICGTDQDLYSGECSFVENGQVTYPLRTGHEWSGIVEDFGAGVKEFKKGDRVVGDNAITCGKCKACLEKDYPHCEHMLNVGTIDPVYDGAFSEYYVIPFYHLHKIPDYLSLKAASLAEPLSVAYCGIKKMNITESSAVAVIGTGCIGLSAAILAKSLGSKKVFIVGRNSQKLEVAQKIGVIPVNITQCNPIDEIMAQTDNKGADFVLECSGAAGTFLQAVEMAAFRAKIALIGFYDKKENGINVDAMVSKALTIFGVMGEFDNMSGVLNLLEKYKPDLLPIITEELPFDDCIKGFNRKNYRNSIKIAVKINEE